MSLFALHFFYREIMTIFFFVIVPLIKIRGVTDKPVKLDWVPPNASTELVNILDI